MKKLKPSELEREAQRLVVEGKMPSLEELLSVISETRKKYAPLIVAARNQAEKFMTQTDSVLDFMKRNEIAETRENYLEIAFMGTPPEELDAEEEAELPLRLQKTKEEPL